MQMARNNSSEPRAFDSNEWRNAVPLFVAPLLVFLSAFSPGPLTLYFSIVEVIAVAIAVALAGLHCD